MDISSSPLASTEFAVDQTSNYQNLSNTDYWTKTHFGSLINKTIGVDYQRGDNIYYQGKHYIYTSNLDSNDQVFTAGSGQTGVQTLNNYFSKMQLLS